MGNSPSISRDVSVSSPTRKATWDSSTKISSDAFSSVAAARPASLSARSGTIALPSPSAVATRSRTARRYESVATITTPSRLTSISTPVSTGRASSRDAPRATWCTASANAPASAVIRVPPGSWSPGKSSAGNNRSVPSYAAQRMCACD